MDESVDTRPPAFSLRGVSKRFGAKEVLRGVDLEVPRGQCAVILGPSGSGKSVLMRVMLGFFRPDQGRVRVFGELPPFSPYRKRPSRSGRLGVLFQNDALFEDCAVEENLALAVRSRPGQEAAGPDAVRRRSAELVKRVGLEWDSVAPLRPSQLSGGMRKRVALARALAPEPDALVIDEPTAGLDVHASRRIVELLKQTLGDGRMTAVFITHDLGCARQLADRLYFLSPVDGRLERIDPSGAEAEAMIARLEKSLEAPETRPRRSPGVWAGPGGLAQKAASVFEAIGQGAASVGRALPPPALGEFLRRCREMTVNSLPLAAMVFLMMGMLIYVQVRIALAPLGLFTHLPKALVEAGLKLTPALVGLIMAGRIGSAICAEMAILRQTEQLEAMRVLGLAPERRLLGPWLWSALASLPLLVLFSEGVASLGAVLMLALPGMGGQITPRYFWRASLEALEMGGLIVGLAKAALFGAAIVLAAYFFGAREQRGASAVGRSITGAMVASFILIIALDFVVSLLASAI